MNNKVISTTSNLRFRNDPINAIISLGNEVSVWASTSSWRSYENYIGQRILYPAYTTDIRASILKSSRLHTAIQNIVEKANENDRQKLKHVLWKQALLIINNMIAELDSIATLRVFAFFVTNAITRMYHQGIHIQNNEFSKVKQVAEYAMKNQISMIYLPCHKSHMDYLVISYVFYRLGLSLPHIAAGDNLNMPFVGSILKHCGAFYIKRSWGDDPIYLAIVKEYIQVLLEKGTRSRMGKLLQPKFGLIKIILDAVLSKSRVKDCIIVPMSIGYDKVIESSAYVNELLGTPKEKETLSQLLSNFNLLSLKWGRIDVRFGEPFSLNEYISQQVLRRGSSFKPATNPADHALLLQGLGFRILGDINNVSVIMPTALIGTILLTLRGRGVGRDELIRKVNWLTKEILKKDGRVADFAGMNTGQIVDRAIPVLKGLISVRVDLLEPTYYPNKRFELSLYRNQVIHLFISEAVISTALYATIKAGGPTRSQRVKESKLLEDIKFLSTLLKSEFIFTAGSIESNMYSTLDNLVKSDVLIVEPEIGEPGQGFVEKANWVCLSEKERKQGREHFDFYCFLLWPFIETYWLVAVSLFSMIPDDRKVDSLSWIDERVFLARCQFLGKSLYYEGDVSYLESVNIETIKNALKRLKDMGLLMHHVGSSAPVANVKTVSNSNGSISWIRLDPGWLPQDNLPSVPEPMLFKKYEAEVDEADATIQPKQEDGKDYLDQWYEHEPKGRLWDFCERIGSYRREGKNRRDTSTVAMRVLRLARLSNRFKYDVNGKKKPVPIPVKVSAKL